MLWLTETTEEAFVPRTPEYAQALKAAGPAYTAMAGMQVIACAGAFLYWEGRAQAWSVLSVEVERYILRIHRAVVRFLNAYPVRRIEIDVDPRSPLAVKWATRLGFVYEGRRPSFTPNGVTMDLYARIRP